VRSGTRVRVKRHRPPLVPVFPPPLSRSRQRRQRQTTSTQRGWRKQNDTITTASTFPLSPSSFSFVFSLVPGAQDAKSQISHGRLFSLSLPPTLPPLPARRGDQGHRAETTRTKAKPTRRRFPSTFSSTSPPFPSLLSSLWCIRRHAAGGGGALGGDITAVQKGSEVLGRGRSASRYGAFLSFSFFSSLYLSRPPPNRTRARGGNAQQEAGGKAFVHPTTRNKKEHGSLSLPPSSYP